MISNIWNSNFIQHLAYTVFLDEREIPFTSNHIRKNFPFMIKFVFSENQIILFVNNNLLAVINASVVY